MIERSQPPATPATADSRHVLKRVDCFYVIERVDFNSMENNPSAARIVEKIGVAADRELAEDLVAKYRASHPFYRGWDGDEYPEFRIVELPSLTRAHLHAEHASHGCTVHAWSTSLVPTPTSTGRQVCPSCGAVEIVPPATPAMRRRAALPHDRAMVARTVPDGTRWLVLSIEKDLLIEARMLPGESETQCYVRCCGATEEG